MLSLSVLTLCDPMDCSPPGSSVHGIPQARILEWLPCPPPGHLPNPGTEPRFPALQADSLVSEPPEKKGGGGDSGPSRVLMGTLKQGVGRGRGKVSDLNKAGRQGLAEVMIFQQRWEGGGELSCPGVGREAF